MKKVVIIGSGIVGSTIAFELSQNPKLDITLIDQNNPGSGATGAALGLLMGIISQKTKGRAWQLKEASLKRYHTLIEELESLTKIKIPHNKDGIVKLLFEGDNVDKWHKLAETRANQGYTLEVWDKTQLKKRCPEVNLSKVIGAVYSPSDLQISPPILTQALVKGASLRGVNCQFGVKVDNFNVLPSGEDDDKFCTSVEVGGASILADFVIISAGLGSMALTESLGNELKIIPVLGQALLVKSDSWQKEKDFNPVITGNDIHIAPMGNNEFWLGATVEFPNVQEFSMADEQLLDDLHRSAIAFCPILKTAPIMLSWSGKRPRPEGQPAPVIQKLQGYSNIILATGHYRNGILLAPATAMQVEQLIIDDGEFPI